MDHKSLKSDMTYALKKMTKEGKTITFELLTDNLEVVDGHLNLVGDKVDVLEAFVHVKGYQYTPVKVGEFYLHHMFGIPITDLISEQGQIAKTDLYDFMDGLENVAGKDKSEFYKVGVYIREKFTPIGVRAETLQKIEYKRDINMSTVRKFIVYNRPMPGCRKNGLPSIVEVDCEIIRDPLAKPGEYAGRILKPEWLWEPTRVVIEGVLGERVLPPVYVSHALFDTIEAAREAAQLQIRSGFEFEVRKGRIESYTDEDLRAKITQVQEVNLT